MKLQAASKQEVRRVALGSAICFAIMLTVFFVLSLWGGGVFDYTVILGGAVGTLVAVGNFTALCLTIQNAAGLEDKKQMKARFQMSYHIRLIFQAVWVVAAFVIPFFHGIAAAIPLLYPTVVIFFLQTRGKLTAPSDRKNPEQNSLQEEERLDSFEV